MRKAVFLAIAPFLAAATLAAEAPSAPPSAVCSPAPGRWAVAAGSGVELRPGGVVYSAAGRRIDALGCADGALVAATSEAGRRPRATRIALGPEGAKNVLETALPGRAVAVAATADRIVAVCAARRGGALVVAGPGGFRRETPLPGAPSALTASPDGTAVFVAVGKELRAFRLDTGGTWIVLTFDGPVAAAAFAPGDTRMLVAVGTRLELIDVADRSFRGVPPPLASADLEAAPRWVGLSRGGAAVALVGAKGMVFDGRDLSPLGEFAVDPAAPGLALDADAAWLDASGALREAPLPAPRGARPAPAAPAPVPTPTATPKPPEPPTTRPPAPSPQPTPAAPPPAPNPQAAPAAQPATPNPPAAPAAQPPAPKPPAAPAAQPPAPKPQAQPAAQPAAPKPQDETPIPEGTIVGAITGRAELAAEIVVAGPDNVLAVAARATPQRDGARAVFRVEGLRPGRYRVVAMGASGASLATTPAWADATLRPGAPGVRVEIRVDGAL